MIGSAFSAKTLAPDLLMLQVAINGLVTAAMLGIIIRLGAATSGAYYNPAVSIALFFNKAIKVDVLLSYLIAQCLGAIAGAGLANAMYDTVIFSTSTVIRSGTPLFIGEVVATAGLDFCRLFLYRFFLLRKPGRNTWSRLHFSAIRNLARFDSSFYRGTTRWRSGGLFSLFLNH